MTFFRRRQIYLETNPFLLPHQLYNSAAVGEMIHVTDREQAQSLRRSEYREKAAFLRGTNEQNAASLRVLHVH